MRRTERASQALVLICAAGSGDEALRACLLARLLQKAKRAASCCAVLPLAQWHGGHVANARARVACLCVYGNAMCEALL